MTSTAVNNVRSRIQGRIAQLESYIRENHKDIHKNQELIRTLERNNIEWNCEAEALRVAFDSLKDLP